MGNQDNEEQQMSESVEFLVRGVAMGVGGSALIDVWALLVRRTLKVPTLDYAFLGRWIGYSKGFNFDIPVEMDFDNLF